MNIEAEAKAAAGWFGSHLHHRTSDPSHQGEQPVTTPQQPQRLVDSLHQITGEIQANNLVARLLEHGLGRQLSPADTDHICGLVWSLQQVAVNVPAYTQHDDSTPFPADGQHQQ